MENQNQDIFDSGFLSFCIQRILLYITLPTGTDF